MIDFLGYYKLNYNYARKYFHIINTIDIINKGGFIIFCYYLGIVNVLLSLIYSSWMWLEQIWKQNK